MREQHAAGAAVDRKRKSALRKKQRRKVAELAEASTTAENQTMSAVVSCCLQWKGEQSTPLQQYCVPL